MPKAGMFDVPPRRPPGKKPFDLDRLQRAQGLGHDSCSMPAVELSARVFAGADCACKLIRILAAGGAAELGGSLLAGFGIAAAARSWFT